VTDRKRWEQKLDELIRQKVRVRDEFQCQRCHRRIGSLQVSHYYDRVHRGTRWDLKNVDLMCGGCHMRIEHDKQGWYTDFKRAQLGERELRNLRTRAEAVAKFSIIDLQWLYQKLQREEVTRMIDPIEEPKVDEGTPTEPVDTPPTPEEEA